MLPLVPPADAESGRGTAVHQRPADARMRSGLGAWVVRGDRDAARTAALEDLEPERLGEPAIGRVTVALEQAQPGPLEPVLEPADVALVLRRRRQARPELDHSRELLAHLVRARERDRPAAPAAGGKRRLHPKQ